MEEISKEKKNLNQAKQLPKDAQVIISILRDLGVEDFEPRVINQLLEFTYRYVTTILEDAKVYANHSKKKGIDLEDVKLASTMLLDKSFTGPPPREVLFEVAKQKNSQPLLPIKPHSGLRLPPDRHCLLAANYKLRAASSQAPTKKLVKSALEGSTIKTKLVSGSPTVGTAIKKTTTLGQTLNKTSSISIPKPTFKVAKPTISINKPVATVEEDIKMDIDADDSFKRKRELDDFDDLV